MTGAEVKRTLTAILPGATIAELARAYGVVERAGKQDLELFVRSMILAAGDGRGGVQADVLRRYVQSTAPEVSRTAFYKWFNRPLEDLMADFASRAIAYAQALPVDVPAPFNCARDWHIFDSETVKVRRTAQSEWQGTGDYAALKVHKRYSIGCGATVAYHISPAVEHDSLHLEIDESWRGLGLLADLGYASLARLRQCQEFGVFVVIRLKEGWKPRVHNIGSGTLVGQFLPGTEFDAMVQSQSLVLDGSPIDLEVELGRGANRVRIRLCGAQTPKGYCFYLTNLPATISPGQVCQWYRVRWEIETSNKIDKSVHRLAESKAEKPCSIMVMVHASLIASNLTAALVHLHNLTTKPAEPGAARTKQPVHHNLLARALASAHFAFADALRLVGRHATKEWDRLAQYLVRAASDPNWKTRPSVLDQLRGWPPPKPKKKPTVGA